MSCSFFRCTAHMPVLFPTATDLPFVGGLQSSRQGVSHADAVRERYIYITLRRAMPNRYSNSVMRPVSNVL